MIAVDCEWVGSPFEKEFSRILPNGQVDQTLDYVPFSHDVEGFTKGTGDSFYAFGLLGTVDRISQPALARLIPDTAPPRAKYDFDGDGKSDFAVFRPSDGVWYLNESTAGIQYVYWGFPTDKPTPVRYDSSDKTEVAIFRDGVYHISSRLSGWRTVQLGQAGDRPIIGNFDDEGDELDDWAVRGIRNGSPIWLIKPAQRNVNPSYIPTQTSLNGELASDKPIIGDFNADSRDDIGYFRDGFWYTRDYYNYGVDSTRTYQWGSAGDIPVPADFDGDRQTDYAIFRPSTGEWWVNGSTIGVFVVRFGLSADIPVPADYDGDGKVDIAIYRQGVWWLLRSSDGIVNVVNWGLPNDIPVSAQP